VTIEPTPGTSAAGPPGTSLSPLACCPLCASSFSHLRSWHELSEGRLRLELRCGECHGITAGDYDPAEVEAYDRAFTEARLELTALHAAIVRSNLQEEAQRLSIALALDLICADDFAGYNRRALRGSSSK
jgi:hypothetical protein